MAINIAIVKFVYHGRTWISRICHPYNANPPHTHHMSPTDLKFMAAYTAAVNHLKDSLWAGISLCIVDTGAERQVVARIDDSFSVFSIKKEPRKLYYKAHPVTFDGQQVIISHEVKDIVFDCLHDHWKLVPKEEPQANPKP